MTVSYNNGAVVTSSGRALQGTGAAPANLTISDGPTFNFGTKATGSSSDKTFTITNTGGVPATSVVGTGPTSPFSFKGGAYPGTGGTCASSLAALATCTVVVTYAPTSTGAHSSTIDMGFQDGVTSQTSSRPLQGTGAAPATLTISDGPTYSYGTIAAGGTADKTLLLPIQVG